MNTTVDERVILLAEKDMTTALLKFSNNNLSVQQAVELSKEIVNEIDWNNSALMHKGIGWIAKNYLEKLNLRVLI